MFLALLTVHIDELVVLLVQASGINCEALFERQDNSLWAR